MPTFSVPTRSEWTFAEGAPEPDKGFWGHFGTQTRGRSVIKIAGVWTTVDGPTLSQVEDATEIINPDGERVPGVFIGARTYEITNTVKTELVAAGYTVVG